ncbi:MAG: methyltransferase domain-containing protein [Bdellovibrionales bacterium]|nr:methyltransferase domain-containing protein [Bdellovibrionales bacterium]
MMQRQASDHSASCLSENGNQANYAQFFDKVELANMLFGDDGLRMAIPQAVGRLIAQRLPGEEITELCCGVGSLSIALALEGKRLTALDTCPEKIRLAKVNAQNFGVSKQINFLQQDCRSYQQLDPHHTIICDPPWGGSARRFSTFRFSNFELDVKSLLISLVSSQPLVALKLPFNFDFQELKALPFAVRTTAYHHQAFLDHEEDSRRPLFWIAHCWK